MTANDFGQALWRQRVVVAAVLLIGLVTFGFITSRGPTYSASSVILAGGDTSGNAVALDPTKSPLESAISPADLPALLHSHTVITRVAQDLHLTPERAADLAGHTKAKPSGVATIPITVTDVNAQRAVDEANALAKELQRFEQEIAESRYDLLIRDLRAQLDGQRRALGGIDGRIAALASQSPFVTATNGVEPLSTRLAALSTQRDQLRAQLLGDAAAYQKAAQRPGLTHDLAGREIVANDPVFQSLRTQYGKDLAQYNLQRAGYTDDFPGLAGAKDLAHREQSALASATTAATKNLELSPAYVAAQLDSNKAAASFAADRAQLAEVERQYASLTQALGDSKDASVALDQLRRERDADSQAFAQLSNRLALAIADRSQAASVNSIVLVDEATGAAPTLLSRPVVVFAALAVAFAWLAISLALLVDRLDGRLRTRTSIEELYGTNVLASVG